MPVKHFASDPRWFQLFFQTIFMSYGLLYLGWTAEWDHYLVSTGGAVAFNYLAEGIRRRKWPAWHGWRSWGLSALISAMSLCLLLKTGHWYTSLLAALLTIASKYILRVGGKHIFNPSAFGIVATLLITQDAWLSPGQWGSNALLFFLTLIFGTIVVTSVQKLDTSLAFLLTFVLLTWWRQTYVLGWPADHFFHSITTGSLLLFSFFMISDPRTSPDHPFARIIWASLIAAVSFYLAAFEWKYNTSIWVLIAAAPLVPMLDRIFRARPFTWSAAPIHFKILLQFKKQGMRTSMRKAGAVVILITMISHDAAAFCGFYVSKADGTLKNKTSQVIIVHDGDRSTITMYNDFKGDLKDFAMVVPVPVVLKERDIKVVDQKIFATLNDYSQPRLVEYYDENPCAGKMYELQGKAAGVAINDVVVAGYGKSRKKDLGVRIEAKYLVGEYDILILSAKESQGLKTWLTENGYKIPAGAEEVLEPYIRSNLKFFVVKVNGEEKKKLPGNFLRPIQISFSSPRFMLPIRLGMANAEGDQDMIVYAFSKKGRVECANYRTVSLPTGKNIPLFVQHNFGNFYSNLFQHQWKMEGKAVTMLEYAWDVSPRNYVKCDPCIASAPSRQDLVQAGVWWMGGPPVEEDEAGQDDGSDKVYFTRLHVRYNRKAFPQDLLFQATANTENFQARYIITHPATGDLNCPEGKKYLEELKERRKDELEMLTHLTGKGLNDWDLLVRADEEGSIPAEDSYAGAAVSLQQEKRGGHEIWITSLGVVVLISLACFRRR
jgi:Na+-translocating ferredoxin:NAD+ oxidoreductase RnfD subunit